jgi:hypothetical protein
MTRPRILITTHRPTFVPPNHPNWSGKSHRSTAEAYGSSIAGTWSEHKEPGPSRGDVLACCFVAAVLIGFLFIGPAVFGAGA